MTVPAPAGVQLGVTDLTALVEQMEANAARLRDMLELATAPTWHNPGMAALEDVRAGDRVELDQRWEEVHSVSRPSDGLVHLCLLGSADCYEDPPGHGIRLQQRGDR